MRNRKPNHASAQQLEMNPSAERSELSGSRRSLSARGAMLPVIAPGEVLSEEFLKPLGVSQNGLARAIGVPPARVNEIIRGRRAITADTAVRLSLFFGTSIESWINLQAQYDARIARAHLQPRLQGRIRPFAAA